MFFFSFPLTKNWGGCISCLILVADDFLFFWFFFSFFFLYFYSFRYWPFVHFLFISAEISYKPKKSVFFNGFLDFLFQSFKLKKKKLLRELFSWLPPVRAGFVAAAAEVCHPSAGEYFPPEVVFLIGKRLGSSSRRSGAWQGPRPWQCWKPAWWRSYRSCMSPAVAAATGRVMQSQADGRPGGGGEWGRPVVAVVEAQVAAHWHKGIGQQQCLPQGANGAACRLAWPARNCSV